METRTSELTVDREYPVRLFTVYALDHERDREKRPFGRKRWALDKANARD